MSFSKHRGFSDNQIQEWEQFLRNHDCPEKEIHSIAAKLNQLPEDLKDAAIQWDKTGRLPDIEAEGFTARQLNDIFGFKEIAAILMLGWLRRAPEQAKYALTRPISKVMIDQDTVEALKRADEEDVEDRGS